MIILNWDVLLIFSGNKSAPMFWYIGALGNYLLHDMM